MNGAITSVWLALGSNKGDREAHLRQAVRLLQDASLRILRISPVYETAPQGYLDQEWFLNLVLEAETSLSPLELLDRCASVERALGRQRTIANGPRTIDVDIVFFGKLVIANERLQVPHPRYRERRFVLQPLADLTPDLRDPVTGGTVGEMLAALLLEVEARHNEQPIRATDIVIAPDQIFPDLDS